MGFQRERSFGRSGAGAEVPLPASWWAAVPLGPGAGSGQATVTTF